MASINISEDDFLTLAMAASEAQDSGDKVAAKKLDKLARKVNAALTASIPERKIAAMMGGVRRSVRWQDMPSTLDP